MLLLLNKKNDTLQAALLENGRLTEIYFPDEDESVAGNIFVGKIEKFVPALEAAFVKLTNDENGFLRIKDIRDEYLNFFGLKKLQEGQKVLVQVKKESGTKKGPQVTTNIGLPGRYVVLMPFSHSVGISRKIHQEEDRVRLKKLGHEIRDKFECGVILRTASSEVSEEYIWGEVEILYSTWLKIVDDFKRSKKVKLLYKDLDTDSFVFREFLKAGVEEVIANSAELRELVRSYSKNIRVKVVETDVFEEYGVNKELKRVLNRSIPLPSGGEIVVDKTEAMVVIDVNSGHYTSTDDHEQLSEITNLEAVKEIARILRLRNLGGMIIVDFIDMKTEASKNKILQAMKAEVMKDRNRVEIYGFTQLGLLEMTRKRTTKSLDERFTVSCPVCSGSGRVINPQFVIEKLMYELTHKPADVSQAIIKLHPYFKELINKEELRQISKLNVHLHFMYHDPNSYELSWKK
ncbi:MAG: Rne/Rng family ribonuclease [Fervidobacterium sp.]|uniref:Ribonuclease G n=1 Tax=Fervidobacterium gondwanense DSM 13020 TaxID=1121883 RepID=A0A1M7SF79_FERGO|nr:Rne/Rng family ribonuclease [Fervidobacterium gondwanense]SHN57090.1 ribonuclease G [Fervidobacterium gondwanense DSM 13020]